MSSSAKIRVYPRIHVSLLSMHLGGYRRNGGIGFAIDSPSFTITATRWRSFEVFLRGDSHDRGIKQRIAQRLCIAREEFGWRYASRIDIDHCPPHHSGFGTGTTCALAAIESSALVNGQALNRVQLSRASGRGGTSGVGINTYFSGGMTLDTGHPTQPTKQFFPSDAIEPERAPLLIASIPMPAWDIGLCVPRDIEPLTLTQEKQFFRQTCPLTRRDTVEIIYHALCGAYSAAVEGDYKTFCTAIESVQRCAWKRHERRLYGNAIGRISKVLLDYGADCVGMSSMGPLLYFLGTDLEGTVANAKRKLGECNFRIAAPRNSGREIELG